MRRTFQNWMSYIYIHELKKTNYPNKFSFAVPEGLISKDEIPDYAGLYYLMPDGTIKEIKRAKFLHKEKFTKWKTMASKFYWKVRNGSNNYKYFK